MSANTIESPTVEKGSKEGASPAADSLKSLNPGAILRTEFADLDDYIDSKRQQKSLSNSETLAINYEKGLYPYPKRMSTREYEQTKLQLQAELLKAQRWIRESGQRIVALFEGRDAAGKGGTIKRFMEHLNPRTAHRA